MKTFKDCCNEVAKLKGYVSFNHAQEDLINNYPIYYEDLLEESAELFAKEYQETILSNRKKYINDFVNSMDKKSEKL